MDLEPRHFSSFSALLALLHVNTLGLNFCSLMMSSFSSLSLLLVIYWNRFLHYCNMRCEICEIFALLVLLLLLLLLPLLPLLLLLYYRTTVLPYSYLTLQTTAPPYHICTIVPSKKKAEARGPFPLRKLFPRHTRIIVVILHGAMPLVMTPYSTYRSHGFSHYPPMQATISRLPHMPPAFSTCPKQSTYIPPTQHPPQPTFLSWFSTTAIDH